MEKMEIIQYFQSALQENVALPVAAMLALVSLIKNSTATTWMELEKELRSGIAMLHNLSDLGGRTKISLGSGCDLFMKYVTRAFLLENTDFATCKKIMLERGETFANLSLNARNQIAEVGHSFFKPGCVVLLHGISRVVMTLVLRAAKNKKISLIITEGRPGDSSLEMVKVFNERGITTQLISDTAVGVAMEKADLCLVGAEGVMENGGIINKIGTYQTALVAKALDKPFYVAVEAYKFARNYPLQQSDIIQMTNLSADPNSKNIVEIPTVDFTPSRLITLLFTDLGVLTPAAVSDELIRLFQ